MEAEDARREWRRRQVEETRAVLRADVAQGALEGFLLVRPDGSLTSEVVHVQWEDNHSAGPDTHATVAFADGARVEFEFDTPVVKAKASAIDRLAPDDLRTAAPAAWGIGLDPWR